MTQETLSAGLAYFSTPYNGWCCATVNQFVMIGGTGSDKYSVQWSAIGTADDWPTPLTADARSKQSGSQSMPNKFGVVTAIAGNDFFAYIFQERAITKATYIGGDVVFAFDTFEEGRGCFEYNRIAISEDAVYFESDHGYHLVRNGAVQDIGKGVVDDTYPPQGTTRQSNVVINEYLSCVFFESQNLCFNYKTNQWSRIPAWDGAAYYQAASAAQQIGRIVFSSGAVDLQTQNGGAAQEATLTTGETDLNEGGRTYVDAVRPIVRGGTSAVRVGIRDDHSDSSISWSTGTSVNSRTGMANFRGAANTSEGRYQRVETKVTGGFTTAIGIDVEFEPSGRV